MVSALDDAAYRETLGRGTPLNLQDIDAWPQNMTKSIIYQHLISDSGLFKSNSVLGRPHINQNYERTEGVVHVEKFVCVRS